MELPCNGVSANETSLNDAVKPAESKGESCRPLTWAERACRASLQPSCNPAQQGREALPASRAAKQPSADSPPVKNDPPAVPAFAVATKDKPVVVLDAGALMRVEALDRYRQKCTFVTTAEAMQEVRDAMARQRIGARLLDIHTLEPTAADQSWAEKFADMTGDRPFLSRTDLGLIALTYMLQRATGQTKRLKLRPPAFEYFSEAELQSALESSGDSKHLWTLQRVAGPSDISGKPEGHANPAGSKTTEVQSQADDVQSADDSEDSEEEMGEDDGWVTEGVLRNHLGLAGPGETTEHRDDSEHNADASGNGEALCDASSGLELRAHLQDVEDLVSCMTTDFSIQNVLLQMGLGVLAVDGRKIRTVKVWALLCRACGHVERKTKLLFCPKCGHYTLDRAPLYFDQSSGKVYVFDGRKRFSKRGQVYSIPKDTGGKHSRPIILAADQLMMGGLDRELRRKEKLWKKDVESKNPFSPNYCLEAQSWHLRAFTASGRAAAAAPPKVVVGLGPGNPNSNRWMKHRTRQRK